MRHLVQSEPDDQFLLRVDFRRGIAALGEFDLAYYILIHPRHFPAASKLVTKFPSQRFIIDHLAKPPIKEHLLSPWAEDLHRLAHFPNLACKISGMVTEADWQGWQPQDFNPSLDVVLEAFGPSRVMYGSDWPVCLLAAGYPQVCGIISQYLEKLSPVEQEMIWGETAVQFYHL